MMAVETTMADSSETVTVSVTAVHNHSNSSSEQASPDSSSSHRHSSVIRSIKEETSEDSTLSTVPPRIEVIVGPNRGHNQQQHFQPEFRPASAHIRATGMMIHRRSSIPHQGGNNTSSMVSSSTSPGPSFRDTSSSSSSPVPPGNNNVMGPPPPPPPPPLTPVQPSPVVVQLPMPALVPVSSPIPASASKKTVQNHQPRIRKSTAASRRQHAPDHEEPSSSIPEIEFDGTTVLCRVCGDKASGFHYGVHSCEGCKGFFRRSIQQKIQYRPCTKNQQCSILRINRNRCQYCRLKKCVAVGMSRDAVRFGRVPKREKAKILAAMQSVNARLAEQRTLPAEFADDVQLMQAVIRAHMETCDFTRDKVQLLMADAHRQPNYTACPPTLACPLNPTPAPSNGQQQLLQDFSERFLPAIRDVVEFAKRLPGFSLLAEDDKVTLLKPGVFEVLLVRLAAMFDTGSNTMLCLNGQLLRRDALHNSSNARFLMDSMFEFAERLNGLQLNDAELGLFCAVVIVAADRPGLRNVELVERMQSKLRSVLDNVLSQAHPDKAGLFMELLRKIPDLRTLNTLHSEKLLAFKMTEQQQQYQTTASWSNNSRDSYDEDAGSKSPMGSSVSSSGESACSSHEAMSDLPLLAAVAVGGVAHHHHHLHHHHHHRRPRGHTTSENGSSVSSDGEEVMDGQSERSSSSRMTRIVESPASSMNTGANPTTSSSGSAGGSSCPYGKMRKLADSPDDSGIESGVDRYEKLSTASRSTNTSLCSSPRSSLEDKVKDVDHEMHHHHHSAQTGRSSASAAPAAPSSSDDMPVLKRVLQAPPLFDTNSLMDEAYKPHKKFRALTLQRSSKVGEADVPVRAPVSTSSPVPTTTSVLSAALSSPPGTTSAAYSALCSALTSPSPMSSLTSTHSTLARSLMEGPKLSLGINAEQQRRADLIVANIMRGTVGTSSPPPQPPQRTVLTQGPLYVPTSSNSSYNHHSEQTTTTTTPSAGQGENAQPLNLSLKSPSSSPARSTTPVSNQQNYNFPLHA